MWFGTTSDDLPDLRQRRACGHVHDAVVVVDPRDDRAAELGDLGVAVDVRGDVLAEALGAGVDDEPSARPRRRSPPWRATTAAIASGSIAPSPACWRSPKT